MDTSLSNESSVWQESSLVWQRKQHFNMTRQVSMTRCVGMTKKIAFSMTRQEASQNDKGLCQNDKNLSAVKNL